MSLADDVRAPIRHADRFFIGGQWVQPSSDAIITVIDSGTEETYFTVAEAQAADIARAVTPVNATALDGTCLRGKCDADPELGYELLKRVTAVMYRRLECARVRMLDLYGPRVVPAIGP